MFEKFIKRENEIFDILQEFINENLKFILIGGYAVSAFQHRFSIDSDLVIDEENNEKFRKILLKNKFRQQIKKQLHSIYKGRFESYIKKTELPITIDLLVNSVECRQTDAAWSYEYLLKNSTEKEIKGAERKIKALIPKKELLIALKIHSSRLTDIRDLVALCSDIGINDVLTHAIRGHHDKLKKSISAVEKSINDKNFIDSFKGVFSIKAVPESNIKKLREILAEMRLSL